MVAEQTVAKDHPGRLSPCGAPGASLGPHVLRGGSHRLRGASHGPCSLGAFDPRWVAGAGEPGGALGLLLRPRDGRDHGEGELRGGGQGFRSWLCLSRGCPRATHVPSGAGMVCPASHFVRVGARAQDVQAGVS